MSTTTIKWSFKLGGVLTDADSVVLQDPDNTYGVKRTDTGEAVVAAGTAMTRDSVGVYSYEITDPARFLTYNYWILVTHGSDTYHVEGQIKADTEGISCGPTLADIRRRVVDTSGHFELVADAENEDYTDNGCDCFINAAQRWLDRRFEYHKSAVWLYKSLAAGEQHVTFQQSRVIKEIWCVRESVGRWRLQKMPLRWLRETYPSLNPNAGNCAPSYYTPISIGLAPEQLEDDSTTFSAASLLDYDNITFGTSYLPLRGVWLMPPSNYDVTVQILADWYSPTLSADTDRSYWSVEHPDLLVRATRMQLETDLHRNTEGRKDFEIPLIQELKEIYKDLVAEEAAGPPERWVMQG